MTGMDRYEAFINCLGFYVIQRIFNKFPNFITTQHYSSVTRDAIDNIDRQETACFLQTYVQVTGTSISTLVGTARI
jgi:hypothetical protein